ncbi:hypothetical protein RHMOL_Rhmol03G0156300 [Rhododendron molle]|uniref:Uncharacterized protein n=1 Tax=Rhododendron molle TaxID=49168 RepID=A0ACC0PHB0_RHOML|nr:hypothetical protein RHMOL_Rhmol03G0156300 [Rhododendron molle]
MDGKHNAVLFLEHSTSIQMPNHCSHDPKKPKTTAKAENRRTNTAQKSKISLECYNRNITAIAARGNSSKHDL